MPRSNARFGRTANRGREPLRELDLTDRLTASVPPGLSPALYYYGLAARLGNVPSFVLFFF